MAFDARAAKLLQPSEHLTSRVFSDAYCLRAAYWRIRAARFSKDRLRWYRIAKRKKKHLLDAGADPEAVRLYCLYLTNPQREGRMLKLAQYLAQGARDL